ncbi:MAG: hypothetical protein JHC31_02670 [Sulfurihydrogenibium sp.]|jgi:hypothetical protein|nr:hypothetical protein [Sulfurihydrogenibium sp.]
MEFKKISIIRTPDSSALSFFGFGLSDEDKVFMFLNYKNNSVIYCYESLIDDYSSCEIDFDFFPFHISSIKKYFINENNDNGYFSNKYVKIKAFDFFSNSNIEEVSISGKRISESDFFNCFNLIVKVDFDYTNCKGIDFKFELPWFMA